MKSPFSFVFVLCWIVLCNALKNAILWWNFKVVTRALLYWRPERFVLEASERGISDLNAGQFSASLSPASCIILHGFEIFDMLSACVIVVCHIEDLCGLRMNPSGYNRPTWFDLHESAPWCLWSLDCWALRIQNRTIKWLLLLSSHIAFTCLIYHPIILRLETGYKCVLPCLLRHTKSSDRYE